MTIVQKFQGRILDGLSAGSNQTSGQVEAGESTHGSFQFIWANLTGTLDAECKVQTSNDDGTSWADKAYAIFTISSASGNNTINLSGVLSEEKCRVVYTKNNVSGGTISCVAILKG
jgi:hypothetical protein